VHSVVWSLGIYLSVLIFFFPLCLRTLFHFKNREVIWRIPYFICYTAQRVSLKFSVLCLH